MENPHCKALGRGIRAQRRMWHSFCSQVAYSNQDGEISHEKINNDKRSILYAK